MILLSTSWCGPCLQLKEWLQSKGIKVEVVDIEEDAELARKLGIRSIPTLVDGDEIVRGDNIKPYLENKSDGTK